MSNLPNYAPLGNPPPYTASAPPANGHHQPHVPVTSTVINVQTTQPSAPPSAVVLVGGCPSCRVGVLRKSHCTCCGVFWSIILFPIGLLCLLCCTKDRCTNCSYSQ